MTYVLVLIVFCSFGVSVTTVDGYTTMDACLAAAKRFETEHADSRTTACINGPHEPGARQL